jgi:hypothetical protein
MRSTSLTLGRVFAVGRFFFGPALTIQPLHLYCARADRSLRDGNLGHCPNCAAEGRFHRDLGFLFDLHLLVT